MKTTLLLSLLTLAALLMTTAKAGTHYKQASVYKRIEAQSITSKMKGVAVETYDGQIIAVSAIKGQWGRSAKLGKVLKLDQIELKSGAIIYPEEVQFGLVKGTSGFIRGGTIIQKAPHSED